jgi:hypothetical protein
MLGQTSSLIIDKTTNNAHISFHDTHQHQVINEIENEETTTDTEYINRSLYRPYLLTKPYKDFPAFTSA